MDEFTHKVDELLEAAKRMRAMPLSQIEMHRELLGDAGLAKKLFASDEDLARWRGSDAYLGVMELIQGAPKAVSQRSRSMFLRLPVDLHESIKDAARTRGESMNKIARDWLRERLMQELAGE